VILKSGGKQWQATPKNLPRMQRTRAIPVAWLNCGLCPDRPKDWIPIIIIIKWYSYIWKNLSCGSNTADVSSPLGYDILASASWNFEARRYHPLQAQRAPVERGTILQNAGNYAPNDTGSYPKTLDSSKSYILPILSTPLFLNCLWCRRTLVLEVVKLIHVRSQL